VTPAAWFDAPMIGVGDTVSDVTLKAVTPEGVEDVSTASLLGSGKVVLFGVPAAFSPTCSDHHLPGFVMRAEELAAKGTDRVVCVSVNDVFVMAAWGRGLHADGIVMLADHVAEFTRGMGLTMDATDFGLGIRSQRYAAVLQDGVVQSIEVETSPVDHDVSSADAVLARL
jgi:glutaredoxin/glutathione-dependent peroxiredoxin